MGLRELHTTHLTLSSPLLQVASPATGTSPFKHTIPSNRYHLSLLVGTSRRFLRLFALPSGILCIRIKYQTRSKYLFLLFREINHYFTNESCDILVSATLPTR